MPLTEATIEPTPTEPASAATPPPSAPPPANDEDETSLARLADDGGPPPPEADHREIALAPTPAEPAPSPAPMAIPAAAPSLEQRVRRLEDALAQLQEQHGIETRIVAHPPASPPAAPAMPASTAALFDAGKRLLGAVAHPAANAAGSTAASSPSAGSGGILWLLWDTWAEARAIVRMFVDPRYHLPWSSRAIPIVLLALILTSKYWMPGSSIPFLGDWLLVKLVDLLLAFLLFKWLGHEARRYRQTSPDLPPTLRL
ncbi:MAG TPA: hypothetical protein VH575_18825 [Gemmataceae bacterium]